MTRVPLRVWRGRLFFVLLAGAAAVAGCKSRDRNSVVIARKTPKPTAASQPAAPGPIAAAPLPAPVGSGREDKAYWEVIRPMLSRHRCDSTECHGNITFRGGFHLSISYQDGVNDYRVILNRIDRKAPEKSLLVQKLLNQVAHNGGKNLDEKSCDMQRLMAWIGQRPAPACIDPPPPDEVARFQREVMPALGALGCVEKACHGGEPRAMMRFDMTTLTAKQLRPELALLSFKLTAKQPLNSYQSPIVRAMNDEDGHPEHRRAIDKLSCAYRRIYGFIAQAPEATCDLKLDTDGAFARSLPSFKDFKDHVVPGLHRRGCTENTCHGGGSGDMGLFSNLTIEQVPLHNYLVLTARIEDFAHPEKSTFLRTARNQEPHGGGKRLGGKGDCVDDIITTWLSHKTPGPCAPPPPPSYARYVTEVQPVLDRMTCTNKQCHGGGAAHFVLHPFAKEEKLLRWNFSEVIRQINRDFMPFSPVQLRMREACAYSIIGAWIEGRPKPSCVMSDPDPSIFPRRDNDGNLMHPQTEPGAPPATKI